MSSFRGEDYQRLDWALLQNGAVTLYHRLDLLREDVAWLIDHDYRVHQFDCSDWQNEGAFHDAVSAALNFPAYYGRNTAAFDDCLCTLEIPEQSGCALVFQRFDRFASAEPEFAQWVLEIIQQNSRRMSLWGKRFLALLQSDDPRLSFDSVGACPVTWNRREWLTKDRGIVLD